MSNNDIQNDVQTENRDQNRSQYLNGEIIAPFKEISYNEFFSIKNKNKKCCCCCTLYKLYQKIDDYANQKIDFRQAYNIINNCCNIFTKTIIYSIICFISNAITLVTCFYIKPELEKLKEKDNTRLLDSPITSDEYLDQWFDFEEFDMQYANIQPKYKLWYKLCKIEIAFIIIHIIFEISFIIFLFIQKCKYLQIITEIEKKTGRITKIMIIINFIFFALISIILFLSMYFFIYTIIITSSNIFEDKILVLCIIFATIMVIIFTFVDFFALNEIICFYMDLYFEEKKNNNTAYNENDLIKKGYLFINNNNIEIEINASKNLYLKENKQSRNDDDGKVFEFKKIRSNKIKPDFEVYIKVKNDAYQNMLAITDWRNKKPEQIYKKLYKLYINFGLLIILLTLPHFFHAKDEEFYNKFRKVINNNIYKAYGDFEIAFTLIRYIIYIIILVALLLLMLKRILYGGYMIYKLLNYSNIICHSLNIYNLIIIILNIVLIVLSIKSNNVQSEYLLKNNIKDEYTKVFYIQYYYSYICLIDIIYIIYKINVFRKNLVELKSDLDNIFLTQNEEIENEFQFAGLDCEKYALKEFIVPEHPRYLYYKLEINPEHINIDANNLINNISNNIYNDEKKDIIFNEDLDSKDNLNYKITNNEKIKF